MYIQKARERSPRDDDDDKKLNVRKSDQKPIF